MSTDIVQSGTTALAEKMEFAKVMSAGDLLPRQYRDKPANLLFAFEYADALNIPRINALTSIHVIEGKPSASAELIGSLVRKAGHKLRVVGDDTYAEASLVRADDPDFEFKVRWDMKRAAAAGLSSKAVWKNYPAAMLRSRAITEVVRMGASEALFGVVYTPEELDAPVDAMGNVIERPAPQAPRLSTIPDAPAPAPEPPVDTAPAPQQGNPVQVTGQTAQKVAGLFNGLGVTSKEDKRAELSRFLGREIASAFDMTEAEAQNFLGTYPGPDDTFYDNQDGDQPPVYDGTIEGEREGA